MTESAFTSDYPTVEIICPKCGEIIEAKIALFNKKYPRETTVLRGLGGNVYQRCKWCKADLADEQEYCHGCGRKIIWD